MVHKVGRHSFTGVSHPLKGCSWVLLITDISLGVDKEGEGDAGLKRGGSYPQPGQKRDIPEGTPSPGGDESTRVSGLAP